ncbi:hypothetical protein F5887DRAFT_1115948 [Amanita rubescens]|nr:hypothetical protein F5887DRAFT_1115948 [Amanita rubescens]
MVKSVTLLFGPMLIGSFFNTILYGMMVVQVIIYFQTYKRDVPWIRRLIYFLFIVETVNSGFAIWIVYEPLVLRYGTLAATTYFPLALSADPVMTVLVSTPVQIVIAWRIKVITKSRILAGIIGVLALVAFAGGIWLTVMVTIVRRFDQKPKLHWPALTWLLASAVADILISIVLTWSLSRKKTTSSDIDHAVNRIIRLTIQTGIVTAVFATLDVMCFLAFPHTTINFIWDFSLSKLYANALLSTLNARKGSDNTSICRTTFTNDNVFGSVGSEYMTMWQVTDQTKSDPSNTIPGTDMPGGYM